MIPLLTMAFDDARAQTREPTTGTTTCDPELEYLAYLGRLSQLDHLDIDPGPWQEVGDGMVMLKVGRLELGRLLVDSHLGSKRERWFMTQAPDPGAAFTLEHLGLQLEADTVALEAWDPSWETSPCYYQKITYTLFPDAALTQDLTGSNYVDRYTFELFQDGVMVGRMLREVHYPPNHPDRVHEHWAFYDGYQFPNDLNEKVEVRVAPEQHPDSAAFFQQVQSENSKWFTFAQFSYRELQGELCLGGQLGIDD